MSPTAAAIVILIAVVIGWTNSAVASDEHRSRFTMTTQRADDNVSVTTENNNTLFSIRSPSGISQVRIERSLDHWPPTIVLRLHLKGLEYFQITSGGSTLNAAVSSHDPKRPVRIWKDKHEDSPLDAKSPHWIAIRAIGRDGKPSSDIPLQDGFFEMQLPPTLFKDNPPALTLRWIDFYRG